MLPKPLLDLAHSLQQLPGIGVRSSQKIALDILELTQDDFNKFMQAFSKVKDEVGFCKSCGFFIDTQSGTGLCSICCDTNRKRHQICLVEKPTDVLIIERSQIFRGTYHVLTKLISPLDGIFAEHTALNALLDKRVPNLVTKNVDVELVLFFKPGFSAEATTAYIKDVVEQKSLAKRCTITKLAQGLPMYYNPDTLDQATMVRALEDRRVV